MNQPKLYSQSNFIQTTDNLYVIENFLNLVQLDNCAGEKNRKALDIGCGEGYITSEVLLPKLPESLDKLIGCDISEKMVKFAKDSCNDLRLDYWQLDVCDSEGCSKYQEEFNHVFSFYCFHWIPDQRIAFQNIYNLLKPGGDFLVSFLGTNPLFDVYKNISKNSRWTPYFRKEMISPYHNCENAEDTIREILRETGFERCQCVIENRRFVFQTWNQLKNSVIAVNPILPNLSSADRNQFLQDFTEEVRRIFKYSFQLLDNNNDENIPIEYKLIIIYASKPDI